MPSLLVCRPEPPAPEWKVLSMSKAGLSTSINLSRKPFTDWFKAYCPGEFRSYQTDNGDSPSPAVWTLGFIRYSIWGTEAGFKAATEGSHCAFTVF